MKENEEDEMVLVEGWKRRKGRMERIEREGKERWEREEWRKIGKKRKNEGNSVKFLEENFNLSRIEKKRNGKKKKNSVGMERIEEKLIKREDIENKKGINKKEKMGDLREKEKIMGEEKNENEDLDLKILNEVKNMGMNGKVKWSSRLIGDKESRIEYKRNGYSWEMENEERKLMRILKGKEEGIGNEKKVEKLKWRLKRIEEDCEKVKKKGLEDMVEDSIERIEDSNGLMEKNEDIVEENEENGLIINGGKVKGMKDIEEKDNGERIDEEKI